MTAVTSDAVRRARALAAAHLANEVLGADTCAECLGPAHEDEGYTVDGETVCCGCHEECAFEGGAS